MNDFVNAFTFIGNNTSLILDKLGSHLWISLQALVIGVVIAIPLGVYLGAVVEPVGLVVRPVLGRDHHHRHPAVLRAQPLDDLVARQPGQHHVEQDGVVLSPSARARPEPRHPPRRR